MTRKRQSKKISTNSRDSIPTKDVARMMSNMQTKFNVQGNLLDILGSKYGGNRDIYDIGGYPKCIAPDQYRLLYERNPVAGRVVDAYPDECWRLTPTIKDDSSSESSAFNKTIEELNEELQLIENFEKLDKVSLIGRFGVMLIGFDDKMTDLRQPVDKKKGMKINYVQCYGETDVKVSSMETDVTSKRYGKPKIYTIIANRGTQSSKGLSVHWTRIVHTAQNTLDNEVYGEPILKGVYNNCLNIEQTSCAATEGYWRGGYGGIVGTTDKDVELPPDLTGLKEDMDNFINGFDKNLIGDGINYKTLGSDIKSPKEFDASEIEKISMRVKIPQQILKGAESGSLASDQDRKNWLDKADKRRKSKNTLQIKSFIKTITDAGVLEETKYSIIWPDYFTNTDKEKAEIAKLRSDAMDKYFTSTYQKMTWEDFLKSVMNFDDEVISEIIENGGDEELMQKQEENKEIAEANSMEEEENTNEKEKELEK